MKVLGFTIILLFLSFLTFAQDQVQKFEPLNIEKVIADIDTITAEIDSTLFYIKASYELIEEHAKLFGLKCTTKMIFNFLKPYLIFVSLYILWLVNRRK